LSCCPMAECTPDTDPVAAQLASARASDEPEQSARAAVRSAVVGCERKGWGVVRNAFTEEQVKVLIDECCVPALELHGVDMQDRNTWHTDRGKFKAMLNPKVDGVDLGPNTNFTGASLNTPQYTKGQRHPNSKELMAMSPRLRAVLDEAHGGPRGRKWHIRSFGSNARVICRYPLTRKTPKFAPPIMGWHTDNTGCNAGETIGYLVMVCCQTVRPGGGGTAMLNGSHKILRRLRHWTTQPPCRKWFLTMFIAWWRCIQFYLFGMHSAISEACCEAGDVVLFDPDTIHVATMNSRGMDEFRFAFIMRCNWAADDAGTGPPGIDPSW